MLCVICETRRPRRACPGVNGEICAICCGTEREVTVSCPFDCEYLVEARRREQAPEAAEIPNRDIEVSERFLENNAPLLDALGSAMIAAAIPVEAIDADAREALAAIIRSYRTRESGMYYETRPVGSYASALYDALENAAQSFRAEEQGQLGVTRTRDADVLGVLVFLQRFEASRNNGRARGRSFLHALRGYYMSSASPDDDRSSLLLP